MTEVERIELLADLTEILGGRAEFTSRPVDDERHCELVLAGDPPVYLTFARGALSDSERALVALLLARHRSAAAVCTWRDRLAQALAEPVEPFAGPVRIQEGWEEPDVEWEWPVFVVAVRAVARGRDAEVHAELEELFASLEEAKGRGPYVLADAHLTLGVFPVRTRDPGGEETARAIVDALASEAFVEARAAWSERLRSFPELLRVAKRMLFLLTVAEHLTPQRTVISMRGLGAYEMLFHAAPTFGQAFAEHVLPAQTVALLGADLEQTVATFTECNLNVSEAARRLFMHRNSLLYRIERIRDLTGLDIRRFEDAVTLWSALKLRKL